ncbi:MAG: HlyD family secretion protein [Anaerolineae bacterium]
MKKAVFPILLVIVLVGGYGGLTYVPAVQDWWRLNVGWPLESGAAATTVVGGSGTIEVESVTIAAEIAGRVVAVEVEEGDVVSAGQVVVRLDEALLRAQQEQALAAVDTARANLANVSAAAREESIAAAAAELAQAEQVRDGANAVMVQAQARAAQPLDVDVRIAGAQGDVAMLEKEVEAGQAALQQAEIRRDEASRNQADDQAATTYQAAIKQADAARAALAATQAELDGARQQLALLQALRANPVALRAQATAAEAGFAQAEAAVGVAAASLAAAQAGPMPEEVAVAEAQVRQAEAAAERIAVQLAKATVVAPIDGVVLERTIEPGEVASVAATLLTVADLSQVTLTVYVPEAEIGLVQVGAPAQVTVDAYPDETFAGAVSYIAMEAEFTPKNVQTKEGRTNLVFAVRIDLQNGTHRLKAGMPADAVILSASG